jgi:hypothetical protein
MSYTLVFMGALIMSSPYAMADAPNTKMGSYVKGFAEPVGAFICFMTSETENDSDAGLPDDQIRYEWTLSIFSDEADVPLYGRRVGMEVITNVPGSSAIDGYFYDPSKQITHTITKKAFEDSLKIADFDTVSAAFPAPSDEAPEGLFSGLPFTYTKPKLTSLGLQAPKYNAVGFIKFDKGGKIALQVDSTTNGSKSFVGDCPKPYKSEELDINPKKPISRFPYSLIDKV